MTTKTFINSILATHAKDEAPPNAIATIASCMTATLAQMSLYATALVEKPIEADGTKIALDDLMGQLGFLTPTELNDAANNITRRIEAKLGIEFDPGDPRFDEATLAVCNAQTFPIVFNFVVGATMVNMRQMTGVSVQEAIAEFAMKMIAPDFEL